MLYKMSLIILQFLIPVFLVLLEVNLIDCPEASHLVLVHLPDVVVLDWKNYEAIGVLFKEGFGEDLLGLSATDAADLGGGNILRGNYLRVCAAITSVVLVEHLRAGSLGTQDLGLRELLRHTQVLFLSGGE